MYLPLFWVVMGACIEIAGRTGRNLAMPMRGLVQSLNAVLGLGDPFGPESV
jgi:hypothetical protein